MPKIANEQLCYLLNAITMPAKYLLPELPVQFNGAASLETIDSGLTHCFVQQSEILNTFAMFEGSELKVQLTTGHELHTETKRLLPIRLAPGLEYIVNFYIVNKLTMPIILGMQWL